MKPVSEPYLFMSTSRNGVSGKIRAYVKCSFLPQGDNTACGNRQSSDPHPKFFVGEGKAQPIEEAVQMHGANVVNLTTLFLQTKNVTPKDCANAESLIVPVLSMISSLNVLVPMKASYKSSWLSCAISLLA